MFLTLMIDCSYLIMCVLLPQYISSDVNLTVRIFFCYLIKCFQVRLLREVKRCPCPCHECILQGRGIAPLLNYGIHGGEWSALRPSCFTSRERMPGTPMNRRLGGCHSWVGHLEKISCSCEESNPGSSSL